MERQMSAQQFNDDESFSGTQRDLVHVANGNSAKKTLHEWTGGKGSPTEIFLNAAVDSDVEIGWDLRKADADAITIIVGHEQISLEFFDLESVERLRDVADDALKHMAAARQEGARAMAEGRRKWETGHGSPAPKAAEEPR